MQLDRYHRAILAALQLDGRQSNRELAVRVGLSTTPCWRRLKELESAGIIKGYRAVLDRMQLGLGLLVFAEVQLDDHHPDTVAAFDDGVRDLTEILECHMVSGEHDYVLKIVATDMDHYGRVLREDLLQLPGVHRISSTFVMETTKTDSPYPLDGR